MRYFTAAGVATLIVALHLSHANAQCSTPKEEGSWDVVASSGGVEKVAVRF